MQKSTVTLAAMFSCFFSVGAFSAPVANLNINGVITPPTCLINSDQTSEMVYEFTISPGMFPVSGNLVLPGQTKSIEIICDAATYLGINSATDQRSGTELISGDFNFGLGLYDTNTKIGFYDITFSNITYKTDDTSSSINTGLYKPQNATTYSPFRIDKTSGAFWASSPSSSVLAFGKVFSADVSVKPTINGALKSSDGSAVLDGDAVLAFAFGL